MNKVRLFIVLWFSLAAAWSPQAGRAGGLPSEVLEELRQARAVQDSQPAQELPPQEPQAGTPASQEDTAISDTLHLTEELMIEQQQRRLDSLVKMRLEKEINLLSGESEKRRELEMQLEQIARNDSLRAAEQKRKVQLLKKSAKPYPVILLDDTLFHVYTRSGSLSPSDRAEAISERIDRLYRNDFFNPDTLKVLQAEIGYDIVYENELTVLTISELDALFFDSSPKALSVQYQEQIKAAVIAKRDANSVFNWLKRIGLVCLTIGGVAIVIFVINWLFRRMADRIILQKDKYFKGIRFNSFTLFEPEAHLNVVLRLLTVLRWVTILLALYLSLPLLFSIFPQTRDYTFMLLDWVITPIKAVLKSLVDYLPNLFRILVVYFFTRYAIKGILYLATEVRRGNLKIRGFYPDWAIPTFNIVKFLLYAFMLVVIFPYLPGSGSDAFKGISVFLGILFSIGSSSAIANVVAGLVITYMRPFKVGDRVKIGDITGDVLEKTLLVTRVRTIKNEEITVPNASVLSNHTTNYTTAAVKKGLIVHTTITLGYDVPWKKVYDTLIDAALRTELIQEEPAPFVHQTELQDFYVSYQINAYTKHPAKTAQIYSDLHQHIQDCCNEAGIEIMSPHYGAFRDGNMTTIPEDYLPEDYQVPSFRVSRDPDERKEGGENKAGKRSGKA